MSKYGLHLTYLYPDSFNLHGDRGNLLAFERVAQMLDIDLFVNKITSFNDPIPFEQTDILLISPGELRTCQGLAPILRERQNEFRAYLLQGKHFIVIGTTIALFAKQTIRNDQSVFEGLDLVNATCKERAITYSNDLVFQTEAFGEPLQIIGGQIQMIDVELHDEHPLGTVDYGYGNNHQTTEGIIKDGFLFTNSLGPVFIKNPWFTEQILRDAMRKKDLPTPSEKPVFSLEQDSNQRILEFIDLKIKKYDKSRLEP